MAASSTVHVTLTLPEPLAREADAAGLLSPSSMESLLREEIRRRQVGRLFGAADRLAALDGSPLTPSEIDAEIQAARTERLGRNARDS